MSGADPAFFLGGGALVSCSASTPINHIFFFFWHNTSCIRKPQVISEGGAHPLHPPPRSAPTCYLSGNMDGNPGETYYRFGSKQPFMGRSSETISNLKRFIKLSWMVRGSVEKGHLSRKTRQSYKRTDQ